MNSWKFLVACISLSGALVALPGQADAAAVNYYKQDHPGKLDKFWMKIEDKLELSKDQKEELKTYRESVRKDREKLKEESKNLHKKIQDALESGADQATLDNLGSEWGKVQVKRMALAHKYQKKVQEVLNEEQKAKLEKMKAEHREKWKRKMEERDDD